LLVRQEDVDLPLYDTAIIHSRQAAKIAISGK
ncbi:MAG: aspartate racemase, partial [Desulfovibrio sp.]|nr:aspartate racemase [Desulfovibrio sp.]